VKVPEFVDDVGPGDHACLTFAGPGERLDLLADFVHTGLSAGHKVLCLTEAVPPTALPGELADRRVPVEDALRRGQLAVVGAADAWLADGAPDAGRMVAMLAGHRRQAAREGYPVLRVTADMSWAAGSGPALDQLAAFEARVADLFADGGLCAICEYDRERFDAVTLAMAASVHPTLVAPIVYHEDPVLRISRLRRPEGVRVAGEVDFTRAGPLARAVAESVQAGGDVHVDLRDLHYLDAACASVLISAARGLPPGRTMAVACGALVGKVLRLAGAREVPVLRVHDAHGPR
jgi:ABC-type transporter Mla MlaB component